MYAKSESKDIGNKKDHFPFHCVILLLDAYNVHYIMVIRILFFVLMKISCILLLCVSMSDKVVVYRNNLLIQHTGFSFSLLVFSKHPFAYILVYRRNNSDFILFRGHMTPFQNKGMHRLRQGVGYII